MRIDHSGVVRIGGTASYNASDKLTLVGSGNTSLTIDSTSSTESSIFFADGATGTEAYKGYLQYKHSVDALAIGTSATERIRIDSSGRMLLGMTSTSFPKRLNVQGSSGAIIALKNSDTTSYAQNTNTSIEFGLNTGNTGNQVGACEIRAFKENGTNGNNARALSFYTGLNGGSPTERMRIELLMAQNGCV